MTDTDQMKLPWVKINQSGRLSFPVLQHVQCALAILSPEINRQKSTLYFMVQWGSNLETKSYLLRCKMEHSAIKEFSIYTL